MFLGVIFLVFSRNFITKAATQCFREGDKREELLTVEDSNEEGVASKTYSIQILDDSTEVHFTDTFRWALRSEECHDSTSHMDSTNSQKYRKNLKLSLSDSGNESNSTTSNECS